jgi:arabinofuranan 3-O-arabinosyltransferase
VELRDRAPEAVVQETTDRAARTWLRIFAGCVLLIGIAFIQSPGLMVADTKFDLAVDPAGFLARALHLWDDKGAFGQLQNQAYGYLWPMGPFFVLGSLLDLPGWVVQRLWMGLVLCVGFVGTARLSRALGVRSDVACLVAAFAFALSPRMLTTLGPISIEAWPSAVAPWVLLPLVKGAQRGSPRRMALLAGLGVAMVGGVNAAATFAVLPLGVVWLLTRTPGPRRRSLMLWWPVFTLIGTLWWLIPLVVLGAYSPPFLDFIETASITTFPTTLFDALRGTSDWVPYVDSSWQGGNETITSDYLALNSGIVLMLGLVGMMVRGNRHRVFLLLSLSVGLLLVSMGHEGAVQGWLAEPLHGLLDGSLAPFRNVHKFDPVIRVPLVLGLAFLLDRLRDSRPAASTVTVRGRQLSSHHAVIVLAVIGVIGAGVPALAGRLAPADPVLDTPSYWQDTVDWLDENSHGSTALLVPGSGFADYVWGSPRDEPIQYLANSPWAVRNAIPLAPPGNIRMLDAFEERMTQGEGSPGLATFLGRAGVSFLVVRNDLSPKGDVPDQVRVHQALVDSPQIRLAATFGPDVGGGAHLETDKGRLLVNGGWQDLRPVIEVYEVAAPVDAAVTVDEFPVVIGGPEDLLTLTDTGVLGSQPTRLAADLGPRGKPDGPVILTDGLDERERFFGRSHDGASSVTTPGDRSRSGNPTPDYLLPDQRRWQTSARLVGARRLSASSSMSDSNTASGARQGELPFAAVDGDVDTQWVSGASDGRPAWWQIDFEHDRSVSAVSVTLGDAGTGRGRIRIVNDSGTSRVVELEPGDRKTVLLGGEPTASLRVEDATDGRGRFALAEVAIDGLNVRRPLVLPAIPPSWGSPDDILLRTLRDYRTGCVVIEQRTPCVEDRDVPSEEPNGFDRVVSLPVATSYDARLTARPRAGTALATLLQTGQPLNATGSSVAVPDPRASGLAAIDGDPGTAWTPRRDDFQPQLALNWIGRRWIDGLKLTVDADAPVRRPASATISWPGGRREVELDEAGRATFPRIRTDRLVLRLTGSENAASIDDSGAASSLPVGIGEVRLKGLPFDPITLDPLERTWQCGTGPTVEVNGRTTRTALVASATELYDMRAVEAKPCTAELRVSLDAGENSVRALGSTVSTPDTMVMGGALDVAPPVPATVDGSSPVHQQVELATPSEGLVLRHNANDGWQATQGGTALRAIVVDGWQQGWLTTGRGDSVDVRFGPDRVYRWGVAIGGLLLLALVGLSLVPARRWAGPHRPPLGPRALRPALLLIGGVAAGGLLGSGAGVVCALGGIALGVAARRWLREAGMWLIGGLVGVASCAYFLRPWGNADGWAGAWSWPAYLVLVALSAALALGAEPGPRLLRRMKGSSTVR